MMKIIKLGFVLSALSLFLLSCKTAAQNLDIQSVSYTHTFGRSGATSITATPDSLESDGSGGRIPDFPKLKSKLKANQWQNLISGLNISVLEKTTSGKMQGIYDGPDEIFRVVTKSKEYEFYNVPTTSAGYKQLQKLKNNLNKMVSQKK